MPSAWTRNRSPPRCPDTRVGYLLYAPSEGALTNRGAVAAVRFPGTAVLRLVQSDNIEPGFNQLLNLRLRVGGRAESTNDLGLVIRAYHGIGNLNGLRDRTGPVPATDRLFDT